MSAEAGDILRGDPLRQVERLAVAGVVQPSDDSDSGRSRIGDAQVGAGEVPCAAISLAQGSVYADLGIQKVVGVDVLRGVDADRQEGVAVLQHEEVPIRIDFVAKCLNDRAGCRHLLAVVLRCVELVQRDERCGRLRPARRRDETGDEAEAQVTNRHG